jgi:hypothetical protein
MLTPSQPVTLTASQIAELNQQLSTMRHDVNNHLSMILAGVELVRRRPESAERLSSTLTDQPARIAEAIKQYSASFERAFGIKRA